MNKSATLSMHCMEKNSLSLFHNGKGTIELNRALSLLDSRRAGRRGQGTGTMTTGWTCAGHMVNTCRAVQGWGGGGGGDPG